MIMAKPARIRLGLVAALCLALIALGFLIARPALLDERATRIALAGSISEWAGAEVTILGPTRVSYFPRLLVETGEVQISSITKLPAVRTIQAKKLEVRLDLMSLVSDAPVIDRITFVSPQITAVTSGTASAENGPGKTVPNYVHAAETAPVNQFVFEDGTLSVAGPETTETFSGIFAKLNLDADGAHSSRGEFVWRDQKLSYSSEASAPEALKNSSRIPLAVNITGDLITANIEGWAVFNEEARVDGNLVMSVPSLPRFARWTGILVPQDQPGGVFSADGTIYWTGRRIGFNEGSFTLDGNRALGALVLDFGGPRPKIDGTLALQQLDLTQYFKRVDPPKSEKTLTAAPVAKDAKGLHLDFPVLHHINFDLRISTTDLVAGPLRLGQSALSVTLNAGKMAADIAIFELCGGSGNGRLELDATVPNSALRLSASMRGISTQSCIEQFAVSSPIDGKADITADVTTSGRTANELIEGLRGKAAVSISTGQVAVNLNNLLAELVKGPVVGWEAMKGDATTFTLLKGDIFLRQNGLYSDALTVELEGAKLVGEGSVDFTERALDLQLAYFESQPGQPGQESQETAPERKKRFVIKGPWSEPTVTPESNKSSTRVEPGKSSLQAARQGN